MLKNIGLLLFCLLVALSGCATLQAMDQAIADSINKANAANKTAVQDQPTSEVQAEQSASDQTERVKIKSIFKTANVRSEPSTQASIVTALPGGMEVEKVDENADWVKVRLAGGSVGWMDKRVIEPDPVRLSDSPMQDMSYASTIKEGENEEPLSTKTEQMTSSQPKEMTREQTEVSEAQRLLNQLGYNVGKPDGIMGRKTRQAISDFEKDNNLQVTGRLTHETMNKLRGELTRAKSDTYLRPDESSGAESITSAKTIHDATKKNAEDQGDQGISLKVETEQGPQPASPSKSLGSPSEKVNGAQSESRGPVSSSNDQTNAKKPSSTKSGLNSDNSRGTATKNFPQ